MVYGTRVQSEEDLIARTCVLTISINLCPVDEDSVIKQGVDNSNRFSNSLHDVMVLAVWDVHPLPYPKRRQTLMPTQRPNHAFPDMDTCMKYNRFAVLHNILIVIGVVLKHPVYMVAMNSSGYPAPRRSEINPRPGHSVFSHVGIVPDDAVDRPVFSGISRFPRPFIPVCDRALRHVDAHGAHVEGGVGAASGGGRHHHLAAPRHVADGVQLVVELVVELLRVRVECIVEPGRVQVVVGILVAQQPVLCGSTYTHAQCHSNWGRGGVVTRLFAYPLDEQGSIPGGIAPGFSHVGIVPDDSSAAPRSHRCTPIGSQDLDVKSRPNIFTHSLATRITI
ncbi:hypothetical protein PR048_033348 [Dryococelus australis]|uniref:Uncharacterized protein n=1 Tax=Dryococelus australis TaxID=614101 RepID=A0ABQ9G2W4_9NEOP|nr:hypothetical protein PR048_033348 [Dryococelus australis]